MLEKMDKFFDSRLNGYEEHQLSCIDSAREFYPFTASCLPVCNNAAVLDLGCGTGLELDWYFKLNPTAGITGIDLAAGMLGELERKFSDYNVKLITGSYFDVPLGDAVYDAAVSVESLHHFTKDKKTAFYKMLHRSLKDGGYFILTDYFASSDEEEILYMAELARLKESQGITDNGFYHYDTPLTLCHEIEALKLGGFSAVEILKSWGATSTIRAVK